MSETLLGTIIIISLALIFFGAIDIFKNNLLLGVLVLIFLTPIFAIWALWRGIVCKPWYSPKSKEEVTQQSTK